MFTSHAILIDMTTGISNQIFLALYALQTHDASVVLHVTVDAVILKAGMKLGNLLTSPELPFWSWQLQSFHVKKFYSSVK